MLQTRQSQKRAVYPSFNPEAQKNRTGCALNWFQETTQWFSQSPSTLDSCMLIHTWLLRSSAISFRRGVVLDLSCSSHSFSTASLLWSNSERSLFSWLLIPSLHFTPLRLSYFSLFFASLHFCICFSFSAIASWSCYGESHVYSVRLFAFHDAYSMCAAPHTPSSSSPPISNIPPPG